MKTNKVLMYVGLIGIIAIVLFIVLKTNVGVPEDENKRDEEALAGMIERDGIVTNVNLEEMMVDGPGRITFRADDGAVYLIALPSMGLLLCDAKDAIASPSSVAVGDRISVRGTMTEGGDIVPCDDASHYFRVEGMLSDAEANIEFPYRKGPNGYVAESLPTSASTDPDFVKGYNFILETDKTELENATDPREGPPTIMVRIYENPERVLPSVWAMRHPNESNVELALQEPNETAVGGANAIEYTADGLYATNTYIVTSNSKVYVFTASYIDDSSPMKADIKTIINDVTFTS